MLIKTYGSAVYGVDAITITVEVNVSLGINFHLVGLPDNAVKESQQRIEAALRNTGYKLPGKKIVVNMAPADIRKQGSFYDLTIGIGILAASGQIKSEKVGDYILMGELSLDGGLQPMKGALPIAMQAKREGFKGVILPHQNASEACVVDEIDVFGVENLNEVIAFFNGEKELQCTPKIEEEEFSDLTNIFDIDFEDVKGQENVKRAIEVAAAGGHNILLIGPPGVGKTMIAKRIPTILPPLTIEEALETTKIHSVAGTLGEKSTLLTRRPYRSPHHTVSDVALVGGGGNPKPGEISLAHNGILFLDELPEFKRSVLEVMRQPLEDRVVTISRAKFTVDYPSSFMLVASMNPSPSGDFYDPNGDNHDSEWAVKRYLSKVSGPLMDRIDIHVEVSPVPFDDLAKVSKGESSKSIRERVVLARRKQIKRFSDYQNVHSNAQMNARLIEKYCVLNDSGKQLLKNAVEKLGLSARSYSRILKVSRTLADLEGNIEIQTQNVAEAIQYRSLDKGRFGSA